MYALCECGTCPDTVTDPEECPEVAHRLDPERLCEDCGYQVVQIHDGPYAGLCYRCAEEDHAHRD